MIQQLDIFDAMNDHADPTDKAVVLAAIRHVASWGRPFSANEVRGYLPTLVSNNAIGPLFVSLARRGEIRRVKGTDVPSTAESTNGHRLSVWVRVG